MSEPARELDRTSHRNPGDDLSALIAQAASQPGIRELLTVYERWRMLDQQTQPIQRLLATRRITVVSNSTSAGTGLLANNADADLERDSR